VSERFTVKELPGYCSEWKKLESESKTGVARTIFYKHPIHRSANLLAKMAQPDMKREDLPLYQPGQNPGQLGQNSGQLGQYPGQLAQYPAQLGLYPGQPSPYPAAGGGMSQSPGGPVYVIQQQPVAFGQTPGPYVSYTGYIILACFVTWCCGWLFGLIAFIFAMMAEDYSSKGRASEAATMAKVSLWLSITGGVVGTILLIVIISISASAGQ